MVNDKMIFGFLFSINCCCILKVANNKLKLQSSKTKFSLSGMWWVMMSVTAIVGAAAEFHGSVTCEEARLKCAYRVGCGMALQNYMVGCSAVLQGPEPTYCPEVCQHALIALTSTEEGKNLMTVGSN